MSVCTCMGSGFFDPRTSDTWKLVWRGLVSPFSQARTMAEPCASAVTSTSCLPVAVTDTTSGLDTESFSSGFMKVSTCCSPGATDTRSASAIAGAAITTAKKAAKVVANALPDGFRREQRSAYIDTPCAGTFVNLDLLAWISRRGLPWLRCRRRFGFGTGANVCEQTDLLLALRLSDGFALCLFTGHFQLRPGGDETQSRF